MFKEKLKSLNTPSHSKKSCSEKVFDLGVDINITPPNYSFVPENCFKLLFCTLLMGDTSPLSQENMFRQSLSDVLSVYFKVPIVIF